MLAMATVPSILLAIPLTVVMIFVAGVIMTIVETFFCFVGALIGETFHSIGKGFRSMTKGIILHQENKPWTSDSFY